MNKRHTRTLPSTLPASRIGRFWTWAVILTVLWGVEVGMVLGDRVAGIEVIAERCLECHNGEEAKSGLNFEERMGVLGKEIDGRKVLTAGDPEQSLLWELVSSGEMPPKRRITMEEKEAIREWILDGAEWPEEKLDRFGRTTEHRAGYDWWSLQPLAEEIISGEAVSGADHPVDYYIDKKLEESGIEPLGEANPREMLRRVYYDLTGLPPAFEEVEKYARNPSEEHWGEIIDELLSRHSYGERWAQHWLDVVRFGESDGYEYNHPRNEAWEYRDWVIGAFNRDLGYEEFVRRQIAGDIYHPDSAEGAAATGFLVAGIHNVVMGKSDAMKRANRHEELADIIGTAGQAFLGLTIHCARCHDHKFDPISMREYYQMIATIDGVNHGKRTVKPELDDEELKELLDEEKHISNQLEALYEARGMRISATQNRLELKRKLAANEAGVRYTMSVWAAPTVWQDPGQVTGAANGLVITLRDPEEVTVAEFMVRPGSWASRNRSQEFTKMDLTYSGTGTGQISMTIKPLVMEYQFGGAIDKLVLREESGKIVFKEDFDGLKESEGSGKQADSGLDVFYGMKHEDWDSHGFNAIHAVEHAEGNLAIQLFGGPINAWTGDKPRRLDELLDSRRKLKNKYSGKQVYSTISRDPKPMKILKRGDPAQPGSVVPPGGLKAIIGMSPDFKLSESASDRERRLKLAEWITHKDNGPFHRTIVNRVWHYHFGQGLTTTPNDLGFNGSLPSHPELLEWLAGWFRDNGYSMKRLHKLILTSKAYRRSSRPAGSGSGKALSEDSGNRLLWRQNPKRLDGEAIRDSMLFAAGMLKLKDRGPGYRDVRIERVGNAHYYRADNSTDRKIPARRTIYRWRARGELNPLLESFDCPDPSITIHKRNITTTPNQALTQWNNFFVSEMAKRISAGIRKDNFPDTGSALSEAWKLILGRSPTEEEFTRAKALTEDQGIELLCRVLLNTSEFVLID